MRKLFFISNQLFIEAVWCTALLAIIFISLSAGIIVSVSMANDILLDERYLMQADLTNLMYFSDAFSHALPTIQMQNEHELALHEQLTQLPGIDAVYEQTMLICGEINALCITYPAELLNRLSIPTSDNQSIYANALHGTRLIWLDFRMQEQFTIGERLVLKIGSFYDNLYSHEFLVAGFLNEENAYIDFMNSGGLTTNSSNLIQRKSENYIMITTNDGLLNIPGYLHDRSSVKLLKINGDVDYEATLNQWRTVIEGDGLGQIHTIEQILNNDYKRIIIQAVPSVITCLLLFVLSMISLIGIQIILNERVDNLYSSFTACGMKNSNWRISWILIFMSCIMFYSIVGCVIGNAFLGTLYPVKISVTPLLPVVVILGISLFTVVVALHMPQRWKHTKSNSVRSR